MNLKFKGNSLNSININTINKVMKKKTDQTTADRLKEKLLVHIESKMTKDEISQGEVARRIGAFRNNVNQIVRGKSKTTLDLLLRISDSIGLDVEIDVRDR